MSISPQGDPGAGEQDAKAVHVDQAPGTQVGDHVTQDNRFTQVTSGRDALVAGRDFYVQDLHVHVGDAGGGITGELRPDGVRDVADDVTADIVVQAHTIHGGIHRHQHIVAGGRPRYRLGPAEPEPNGPLGELSVSQLLAACKWRGRVHGTRR